MLADNIVAHFAPMRIFVVTHKPVSLPASPLYAAIAVGGALLGLVGIKNKEISEDDLFKLQEEAQSETDAYIKKIDEATVAKEKEVMEV